MLADASAATPMRHDIRHGMRHDMRHEIRLFFIALQFLTRLPAPAWVGYEDAWLHQSVRHFPLAGLLVGLFGTAVLTLALALLPAAVAVLLSMAATIWLTGALHEDGLADTCDGLGGTVSRERALEIMKDSRIGSYGTIGLILALGLKAAALTALVQFHPVLACMALLWGHAASRTAPVWLMWRLPYAGDAGHAKAKPLAVPVRAIDAIVASAWVALLAAGLWCVAGGYELRHDEADLTVRALAASVLSICLTTLMVARWLRRRLGGYTGDTLGALQQVTEIVSLLVWLAIAVALNGTHG